MFKKIVLTSLIIVVISLLFGEKASDLIGKIISTVLFKSEPRFTSKEKLLTPSELKLYNGIDKPELYLSILGNVFDVTKGKDKFYGPNEAYNVFVGRDVSRSFITGKFKVEELGEEADAVADLKPQDLLQIKNFLKFYNKEYSKVGKLVGRYFDEEGKPTPYGEVVKDLMKKAEKSTEDSKELEKTFPPCNMEWDAERGTRVWCTERSGGVERDWAGVPRQLYLPDSKEFRCACISKENENLGAIKEYKGCDKTANSCFVTS